jgi:hypothetical protein
LIKMKSKVIPNGCRQRIKFPKKRKPRLLQELWEVRHASLVAREQGVSYAKVWRLADDAGIELTGGQAAKGYWRLSPERRAAVIEARIANPTGTQQEIAAAAGVSRSTVSRIERGDRRRSTAPSAG